MTHRMKSHHRGHHHRRDAEGHGRRRARRGAVGAAILALLGERPMHGYELITALEERSGGRWKPSPGSVYPALHRLEHRGFVVSTDDGDKRSFEITDAGRRRVEEHRASGMDTPWDDHGLGRQGELRRAVAELTGPARQIGRFGSTDQQASAVEAVRTATATLYRILADGPAPDAAASADPASEDPAGDFARPT